MYIRTCIHTYVSTASPDNRAAYKSTHFWLEGGLPTGKSLVLCVVGVRLRPAKQVFKTGDHLLGGLIRGTSEMGDHSLGGLIRGPYCIRTMT